MKRIVSLLLVALLACTMAAVPTMAYAADLTIDPLLLTIFETTPSEYVSDEESRGIFATMALLDAILTEDELVNTIASDAIINDAIYVAYGNSLAVCFLFGDDTCLMIGFSGSAASGTFFELPCSLAMSLLDTLKDGGSISNYWKVPSSTVLEWMQVVLDALES